jgi:hypothetical protein
VISIDDFSRSNNTSKKHIHNSIIDSPTEIEAKFEEDVSQIKGKELDPKKFDYTSQILIGKASRKGVSSASADLKDISETSTLKRSSIIEHPKLAPQMRTSMNQNSSF